MAKPPPNHGRPFSGNPAKEASGSSQDPARSDVERDAGAPSQSKVRCGDCRFFVRDGDCGYLRSEEGRKPDRPFAHAPFWVWSDCYSDREQVRADVTSCCPTFAANAKAEGRS